MKEINHVEADIRDNEKLKLCMEEFQPEFVFLFIVLKLNASLYIF